MVWDPELVKTVLVKDFDHFVDRRNFKMQTERDKIFNDILTNTTGEHWKGIRSVLSPSFTSGRMKGMFPLVEKKADDLVHHCHKKQRENSTIPLRRSFGLYTLEVISSCAFGMETTSLEDGDSVFNRKVDALFKIGKVRMAKLMLFILSPKLATLLKLNLSQPEITFFKDVVVETIKNREETGKRGDFLDLMMEARAESSRDDTKTPKYGKVLIKIFFFCHSKNILETGNKLSIKHQ